MVIAPSVLSLDYSCFKEQVEVLNKCTDILHFDVMDGHFVPNLSFGPDILKTFRRSTESFLDVHLMVSDPVFFSDVFMKAGADLITFHYECFESDEEVLRCIEHIRSLYIKVGISIKPGTAVEKIIPFLDKVDLVLVMSVEPGFGGQSFMMSVVEKIEQLRRLKKELKLSYLIEVDGGINDSTAKYAKEAGADVLVAGSYVFKGDIASRIESLK